MILTKIKTFLKNFTFIEDCSTCNGKLCDGCDRHFSNWRKVVISANKKDSDKMQKERIDPDKTGNKLCSLCYEIYPHDNIKCPACGYVGKNEINHYQKFLVTSEKLGEPWKWDKSDKRNIKVCPDIINEFMKTTDLRDIENKSDTFKRKILGISKPPLKQPPYDYKKHGGFRITQAHCPCCKADFYMLNDRIRVGLWINTGYQKRGIIKL